MLDYRTWLFSLDERDLHRVAADHGVSPVDHDDDSDLIEAIVEKMEEDEKVGTANNGTGYLRVHRWNRAPIVGHISVCGAQASKGIDEQRHAAEIKCKRCFPPAKK